MQPMKREAIDAVAVLVGVLMSARTAGHLAHLRTGSYAAHVVLGEFYDKAGAFADKLAEMAQGAAGELLTVDNAARADVGGEEPLVIVDRVRDACREARGKLDGGPEFQNVVDEVMGECHRAAYKFEFLA